MHKGEPMKPGSIGGMIDDTRMAPRLFELTPGPHTMGIAVFIPLDDPLNRIAHPLSEFWPLLDCMP